MIYHLRDYNWLMPWTLSGFTCLGEASCHVSRSPVEKCHFSHVRLCATPETVAHQAPPSLVFSRQEHWSGLPFPSPMHEREKWKWCHSVVSDSQRPHGLQPTRLLRPWDFPGKSTGGGAIAFSNWKISLCQIVKLLFILHHHSSSVKNI